MVIFLIAFVLLLVIGVPISISIGASAVLGCLSLGYPLVVIGQKMVSGIDSFLLIAVPLFILAGNLMNACQRGGQHHFRRHVRLRCGRRRRLGRH